MIRICLRVLYGQNRQLLSSIIYLHKSALHFKAHPVPVPGKEYLIKEMARKKGVAEELKARGMLRWVGKMNNIRACADEIVLNDIVYS